MAVIYLLMLLYFKSIGGHKPVHINGSEVGDMLADEETGTHTTAES